MKKYLTLISLIIIIVSCDVVESPYMTNPDPAPNVTVADTIKKVLIEDFTGHLCPNCPDAATELEAISDAFPGQIIGMAIHVTKSFARPYPESQAPNYQYDFRTQWGDEWDNFYGISNVGLPRGMINRTGYQDDLHRLGKDEWASSVSNELIKPVIFTINISSDEESISITSKARNDFSGEYNLVVCLTESDIINWQKDGQDDVEDYVHNHVLRTVLVDEALTSTTNYTAGQQIERIINYDLAALEQININYSLDNAATEMGNGNAGGWDSENISIVAYIYNTITKEILQVEEAHLGG